MLKTRVWIAVIAVILIACVVACVIVFTKKDGGKRVEVYVDEELVFSADIENVSEPYEKVIETKQGKNVLEIASGKVRIKDADCDGKDCVHMGWTGSPSAPIVCLPHRLVLKIVGKEDVDVVSE